MIQFDDKGNYPIGARDYVGKKAEKFDYLWRDHLSMLPQVANLSEDFRRLFKTFAWEVYTEAIMTINEVQEIANKAYEDGFKDGKTEVVETVQGRLGEFTDSLDDLKG